MLVGHSGAGDGAANVRRWSYRGSSGVCSEGNRQVQSDNREKKLEWRARQAGRAIYR